MSAGFRLASCREKWASSELAFYSSEYIAAQGLVPGIWFMPFAGTWNDPYWADKQDLFYKEGRSVNNHIAETNGGERPDFAPGEAPFVARWGGTCLDVTNPKTQDYLRSIVDRIGNDWGYKYFKMDGLWTGTGTRLQYVNSSYQDDDLGQTTRFDPSMTPMTAKQPTTRTGSTRTLSWSEDQPRDTFCGAR